ncbi:MAG: hypothetical protein PHW46_04025, partial [Candidatus Omnitrophica bacterium]|nr:hypothetical protein [Candidatus Omnitrophota bacterium]
MNKYSHTKWFKTITILVICLFTMDTLSWAYPDYAKSQTISVGSGFQKGLDFPGANSLREVLPLEGSQLFAMLYATRYLLEDGKEIEFFKDIMRAELPKSVFDKIIFEKIKVREDIGMIEIPYEIEKGKERKIQVGIKGKVNETKLNGTRVEVPGKFIINIPLEEETTASDIDMSGANGKGFPDAGETVDVETIQTENAKWITEKYPEDFAIIPLRTLNELLAVIQKKAIAYDPKVIKEQVKNIFSTIDKNAGIYAKDTHQALTTICNAAEEDKTGTYGTLLSMELLFMIAKNVPQKGPMRIDKTYEALRNLCEQTTKDNMGIYKKLINNALLATVAQGEEERQGATYAALNALCKIISNEKENLGKAMINNRMLIDVANNFGSNRSVAYDDLKNLYEAMAKDKTGIYKKIVSYRLLSAIARKSENVILPRTYNALDLLCGGAANDRTGRYRRLITNIFLVTIARKMSGIYLNRALEILQRLGDKAAKDEAGVYDVLINREIFEIIAKNSKEPLRYEYHELFALCEAVAKGTVYEQGTISNDSELPFEALGVYLKHLKIAGNTERYKKYVAILVKHIPHNCSFRKKVDKAYQKIFDQQFPDGKGPDATGGDNGEELVEPASNGTTAGVDMSGANGKGFPDAGEAIDIEAIRQEVEKWIGTNYWNESYTKNLWKMSETFFLVLQKDAIIVNKETVKKEFLELLTAVTKPSHLDLVAPSLTRLFEAAINDRTGTYRELLNVRLLIDIAEYNEDILKEAPAAYHALRYLYNAAAEGAITGLTIDNVRELMRKLGKAPTYSTSGNKAYHALINLFEAAAKDKTGVF